MNTLRETISMKEIFDRNVEKLTDLYNLWNEVTDPIIIDKIIFEIQAIELATKSIYNKLTEDKILN